jgi:penicillin-binding protein activator
MMKRIAFFAAPVFIILLGSCATTVSRLDPAQTVDLSGRWNDSDSQFVAQAMVDDVLGRPWLSDFQGANKRKPVVIIGVIRNRSEEHINAETFTKDIERELINSNRVAFVASAEEREAVRSERFDQQLQANPDTIKRLHQETGADFYLRGVINSTTDAVEGKRLVAYKVDLELISIETNEKAWIGTKEIKKLITQSSFKP